MRIIPRFIASALAGLGLVLAGLVGVSPAASANATVLAAATPQYCPSGSVCIWKDLDFKTNGNAKALVHTPTTAANLAGVKFIGTNLDSNNSATSMHNNGRYDPVLFYNGVKGTGASGILNRGASWPDLRQIRINQVAGTNWNDKITSLQFPTIPF